MKNKSMSKNPAPANGRSNRLVRWGILGTGYAAAQFAQALRLVPDARLLAVGSHNESGAREFARKTGAPGAYGSGEDLVRDEAVDVVYIATPNSLHRDHALMCLEAGKAVLCEKPFVSTAAEAREVANAAQSRQIFCMEAMWTRFLPLMGEVSDLVERGELGDIRMLNVSLGNPLRFEPSRGRFRADLGGGALMDLGVYGLSLARELLGNPSGVTARAVMGETGVDEQCCLTLTYPQGAMAVITASLRTLGPNQAVIMGASGRLKIHEPVISPSKFSLKVFREETLEADFRAGPLKRLRSSAKVRRWLGPLKSLLYEDRLVRTFSGNGKNYEAEEVVRCLQEGKTESEIMPLSHSVEVMQIVDEARRQFGFGSSRENISGHIR